MGKATRMRLRELEPDITLERPGRALLDVIAAKCQERLGSEMTPVLFAVTERRGPALPANHGRISGY
jgi:hypothetical protein